MEKLDLKQTLKAFYSAKTSPAMLEIPPANFLMIDGTGNPNTSANYARAIEALYAVAYTLKFAVKKEQAIDYPVMPLEGLWWTPEMADFSIERKDDWLWTMMISTPAFIDAGQVALAGLEAGKKKDLPALPLLRFETLREGLCAQVLHLGPYATEAPTIQRLHQFIHQQGQSFDGLTEKHHEIYLSDPRRSAPEKMKTIIRQPVKQPK